MPIYPRLFTALMVVVFLFGCGTTTENRTELPKSEEAPAVQAKGGDASITGKVIFEGTPPPRRPVSMDATPACARQHEKAQLSEEVIVNENGTLRNVFVYVKEGLPAGQWPVPTTPVTIDQKGCVYKPHVIGVMVNQDVEFLNSDPTNHNIHPLPRLNREWNESQPPQGEPKLKPFPKAEIGIPVKCNVHPWMRVYVNVVEHPFHAVTGEDGSFTLKGLPPGEYTLEAWHERYGTQEIKVTAAPQGGTAEFKFKG
jgi:plastocyanin